MLAVRMSKKQYSTLTKPKKEPAFKLKPPTTHLSEAQVIAQVKDYLRLRGWCYVKVTAGAYRSLASPSVIMRAAEDGTPDAVMLRGLEEHFMIEFKGYRGTLRPSQVKCINKLRTFYGIPIFVCPRKEPLDAFIAWYKERFR